MQNSKSSNQSSSVSSLVSNHRNPTSANEANRLPSPLLSDFEYLGRLVTHERSTVRKSNFSHKKSVQHQEIYEDLTSSDDDGDDLNKPLGIIRINDRHFREIYRLPTPPPEIKRVFHRLRSPEPKIIERVFVCRPAQEIIENIIEVPPEKVRIINKEKYLRESKPIIRTKVVHLNPQNYHQSEEQPTNLAYPSQVNPSSIGYTQSTIPLHIMFNSQPIQTSGYTIEPSQIPLNYFSEYSQY